MPKEINDKNLKGKQIIELSQDTVDYKGKNLSSSTSSSSLSFNPYKISSLLYKLMSSNDIRYMFGIKKIDILGLSSKPNENAPIYDSIKELTEIFKDRDIKFETFEPYTNKNVNIEFIKHIYEHGKYILFIGCPHDLISEIRFHGDSVIVDPWGIVNENLEGQAKVIKP